MVPASTVFAQIERRARGGQNAARVHRAGARRRRLQRIRHDAEFLESRGDRPQFRSEQGQPRVARALPQAPHHRQQHRHAHGRGVHGGRSRRRPLPVQRRDVHARASEADGGIRRARRHVDGSALREESPDRTRRFRRCSSASNRSISPVDARTATRASIPTPSAGPRRISRCRWCAIRAWCSS